MIKPVKYNTNKTNELFKKYLALDKSSQMVVNILATGFTSISYFVLNKIIEKILKKKQSSGFAMQTLNQLFNEGFIAHEQGGYIINREVSLLVMNHFSKDSSFAGVIKDIKPFLSRNEYTHEEERDFRIAFFLNDKKNIEKYGRICLEKTTNLDDSIITNFFLTPYIDGLFKRVPESNFKIWLLININFYYFTLGIKDQEFSGLLAKKNLTIGELGDNTLHALLMYKWSSGKDYPMDKSLNTYYAVTLYRGIADIESGNWESADKHFTSALENLKERTNTHFFTNAALLYYIILLFHKNDIKRLNRFLVKADKITPEPDTIGMIEPLKILCQLKTGALEFSRINKQDLDPLQSFSFFGAWVRILCSYWLEDPDVNQKIKNLLKTRKNYDLQPFFTDQFEKLKKGEGLVSLISPIERWNSVLTDLITTLSTEDTSEDDPEPQERLAWRLEFQNNNKIKISPLIQKKGANNKWTQGRQVEFNDVSKYLTLNEISPLDQQLITRIINDDYSWGGYSKSATLTNDAAKLLISHPHVYCSKTKKQLIVEKGTPKISLKRKKNSVVLNTVPTITEEQKFSYEIINDCLTFYFFTDKSSRISSLIGKGLTIPESEIGKITDFLKLAEQHMELRGEMEVLGKGLNKIQGNTSLQILIEPSGSGLLIRIKVSPAKDNQFFTPGIGKEKFITAKDKENFLVVRDFEKEKEEAQLLINSVPLMREQDFQNYEWEFPDITESLEILETLKDHPQNPSLNWPQGEKLKVIKTLSSSDIFKSMSQKNNWFEVEGHVEIVKNKVFTLKQIMALSEMTKSRFIKLDENQYLALTSSLKKELDTLTTYSQKNRGTSVKLHPLALISMDKTAVAEFKEAARWIESFKKNYSREFSVPASAKVQLRDYQKEGYLWMMRLAESQAGALLADDMGLGKTIQSIVMLLQRQKEGSALIVVPSSLCFNWHDEIKRFAPSLRPHLLAAKEREEQLNNLNHGDVLITTYGLIQRNPDLFKTQKWATLILDEAQAVKNSSAQRTKIIKSFTSDFTLITTGTPIENHLGELWNLFDIILPGFLGSRENFREKFQYPIEKLQDAAVRNRLRRLISPFILRRTKEEVLTELPPKTEINLTVDMTSEEKIFYEALRERAIEKIKAEKGQEDSRFVVLAEITRLRQASCHPRLVDKSSKLSSSKLELFGEKAEELIEGNHQALVFSQFTGHLKIIAEYLDSKKIPYFYLDGSTTPSQRGKLVKRFQDGERPLFLISLKAGGSGLNLTGADYVFHMDPWWNPAAEDQASDRAHRMGQERPVTVYRLITSDTIEEKIIHLHQEKRNLAESLLMESSTSLKLNTAELMDILSNK